MRDQSGKTAAQLAVEVGIARSTLSAVERGRIWIGAEHLRTLLQVLNAKPFDWLPPAEQQQAWEEAARPVNPNPVPTKKKRTSKTTHARTLLRAFVLESAGSIRQAGMDMGIAPAHLSHIINGLTTPTAATIEKIKEKIATYFKELGYDEVSVHEVKTWLKESEWAANMKETGKQISQQAWVDLSDAAAYTTLTWWSVWSTIRATNSPLMQYIPKEWTQWNSPVDVYSPMEAEIWSMRIAEVVSLANTASALNGADPADPGYEKLVKDFLYAFDDANYVHRPYRGKLLADSQWRQIADQWLTLAEEDRTMITNLVAKLSSPKAKGNKR